MADFKISPGESACGTSWHGDTINMSYKSLVAKLGEPHATWAPGGKTQYEWVFSDEDGRPVTVYDYKEYGVRYPKEWHVGGLDRDSTKSFLAWFESL